jgi:type I restriction enzyme S subunit
MDWIASEVRNTIAPELIRSNQVFHYSIPVLDETGDGRHEPTDELGSSKTLLTGGEVLISKLNPRKARVLVAASHEVPTVCSGEFVVLSPFEVDHQYLYWMLLSETTRQTLDSQVQSVTRSQQRARPDDIAKMWVEIPQRPAQRAIAEYLAVETALIDRLVASLRNSVGLLQERRTALITEAVTTGVPGGTPRGGDASGTALKYLCVRPPDYGLNISPDRYRSGGIRLLRTSDVGEVSGDTTGRVFLDSMDVPHEMRLADGDILFSRSGTVGRGYLFKGDREEPATFAGFLVRFRLQPDLDPRAIHYWSASTSFAGAVESGAIQSTISNFNAEKYGNLIVPARIVRNSRAIAEYLDSATGRIDGLVHSRGRQIERLLERRQALITDAVNGHTDIPGVVT